MEYCGRRASYQVLVTTPICYVSSSSLTYSTDLTGHQAHWLSAHVVVQAYTAEQESPALLQQEFYAVQAARPDLSGPDGLEGFSIRANAGSREVLAVLEIEEGSSLELAVKLPLASPLRPAEAECRRRVRSSPCISYPC